MKHDKQIDKLFDKLEKEVIGKYKKEQKQLKSKGYDIKGYSKAIKKFYKSLIKMFKIEHDDKIATLICGHLFALSTISQINNRYKKDNFLKKYIMGCTRPMAKITLEIGRKEKIISESEYKEKMEALKVA